MSSPKSSPSPATVLAALRRWIGEVVAAKRRAAQRLELAGMSERELRDLGIGRSEVPEWSRRRASVAHRGAASDAAERPNAPRSCAQNVAGNRPATCA